MRNADLSDVASAELEALAKAGLAKSDCSMEKTVSVARGIEGSN